MKILYVITKSNFGGAQRYVFELATAMKEVGYEVAVAFGGTGILREKLRDANIRIIEIQNFQRDISFMKEFRSLGELWKIYRAEKPDIVHLNSSKAGGSGALMARLAAIPNIVYTAHGWAFWEPRPLMWRILVWLASWATALLCHKIILVSDYEYQHTKLPLTNRKYTVIHTALSPIYFIERGDARTKLLGEAVCERHKNDLWLVTNAELNHNKNLFTAIDAVVAYNKKGSQKIFYSIISDGELKDALTRYIVEKNAEDYIILLGYVDNARTYLHAFDIFLLPSKKEGMPYAILEAGAAGLPVIASRVGGIPEIIEDKKTGLLIEPNITSTITEALQTLSENSALRTQMSTALMEKVKADFSFKQMFDATRHVYEA